MTAGLCPPARLPAPAGPAALLIVSVALLLSCAPAAGPVGGAAILPPSDLSPPLVLDAGPTGTRGFSLHFDEEVEAVEGSFALEPGGVMLSPTVRGTWLDLAFPADQEPGRDYSLAGEVQDAHGNHTRFLFRFVGWNDRPPTLRLSELQTAKNSSTLHPHRDFVELVVLGAGNLGGVQLEWASSVKSYSYRFPSAEVAEGERIVLHLAPEGLGEELDETGSDIARSGGVDATLTGRDFWSTAGGLPDQSAVLALRWRPGGDLADGLFYAADDKTGALAEDKIAAALQELLAAGLWKCGAGAPAWEDGFRWHPSVSRSIDRAAGYGLGPTAWYLSETGEQSPGAANSPAP